MPPSQLLDEPLEPARLRGLKPSADARGHLPALDGLRGIAILSVLLFHFPAPFAFLRPVLDFGWCGVDLFFVLSGYLITGILYASADKPHYFRNFYARRSLRIFPLYYGFIVVVGVLLPKLVDPYSVGLEKLHGNVLPFFLYYSNYANVFSGWPTPSFGALWSLAVEEHFYLFWPALVKFVPKNRLVFWSGIVALFAVANRFAITGLKISWLAAYYLTTSRLDSLAVGAIVAVLARRHPDWLKRWAVPVGGAAALVLVVIAVWRHGLIFNDWPVRSIGYSLLAVLFGSVVWLSAKSKGRLARILSTPILVAFGKYSYCLYICHLLVLMVCERWLGPHVFPALGMQADAPLPLFVAALAGSFAVAALSWRFYESPILALKARFSSTV